MCRSRIAILFSPATRLDRCGAWRQRQIKSFLPKVSSPNYPPQAEGDGSYETLPKSLEDTTGENLRELVTDSQSGYRFANKMTVHVARGYEKVL